MQDNDLQSKLREKYFVDVITKQSKRTKNLRNVIKNVDFS